MENKDLNQLVEIIKSTKKYRTLCIDTIKRIGEVELNKFKKFREAVDSTKRKLHQIHGAYERNVNYKRLYDKLEDAYRTNSDENLRQACQLALSAHASTRERLPILDEFYTNIFEVTGTPSVILDLACGLNPLSLPWMNLPQNTRYIAYDIDENIIEFINQFLLLLKREPTAFLKDIICDPPLIEADVVLLLKTFTTLERQKSGASRALIEALNTRYVVVSFPVRSLGGKSKGMIQNYETDFYATFKEKKWRIHKILFCTELAFIAKRKLPPVAVVGKGLGKGIRVNPSRPFQG